MDQNTTFLRPAARPERVTLTGHYVRLEPLDPAVHTDSLWQRVGSLAHEKIWLYMPDGPFAERLAFEQHMENKAKSQDPLFFAIVDLASGNAAGRATLMRIDPANAVIEIGGIVFSPALQRSREATEAMYLFARYVFEDLGYRRYEWKCNALNEPSRRAALRLGFTFEGIFRQHMIIKGKNRDTAWYSMLDSEWPARKRELERWLDESNFDSAGQQKTRLNESAPQRS